MPLKQYLLHIIKFLIFFGIGIFLVWLVVKDLAKEEVEQIKQSFSQANYWWAVLAMGAGLLAHISRALRWKMLIAPLGFSPKTSNTFYAVMIGYLANLALPRLGEVVRCGILKRYEKIPLTQLFGTVITERVIDLLLLFFLFIVSIWTEYERIHSYLSEYILSPLKKIFHSLAENKALLFLYFGIVVVAVLCVFFFRKKIFRNRLVQKIRALLISFLQGIRSIVRIKNPMLFILHSLFIWLMYFLSVYLCVFAFEETKTLTAADCLVMVAFGSLGVIATPGGIGAYQWIVLQLMLLWGYTTAMGVTFGWLVWLAQVLLVLIFAMVSLGALAVNNRRL